VLAIEDDNVDFLALQHPLLDVLMLAPLFPLYGYVALISAATIAHWVQRARGGIQTRAILGAVVVGVALVVVATHERHRRASPTPI
jgi:hypothetical protein